MDPRKCQTSTATPAEPGGLSLTLATSVCECSFHVHFTVNGTITSPPNVNCDSLVPAAKGVVPFRDVS